MRDAFVRALIGANAAFWLALGVFASVGAVDIGVTGQTSRLVLAALMLGNAAALGLAARYVLRGSRFVDMAAGVVLAVNAALSVADELGAADLAAFAVNLTTLVLLVVAARRQRGPEPRT